MLIRYSDWTRPTDGPLAFPLRSCTPSVPAVGSRVDVRAVVRALLDEEAVARFESRVLRWSGPEDVVGTSRPYEAAQVLFEERGPRARLTPDDVEAVLRGTVLVLSHGAQTDYVMRDHHAVDLALYHYWTRGELPHALLHADRHSDWCRDANLLAKPVDQAATWWTLLEGVKRPGGEPLLRERDVLFATARAEHRPWMPGRVVEGSLSVPGCVDTTEMEWSHALARPALERVDWVSLDLDYLQPSPQLRLARGMLRDERFVAVMKRARVRMFVLSPQFTRGGDRFERWEIHGSRSSSLRLLNLLRGSGTSA